VRTLPEEQLVEHPELAVSAATATTMTGGSALERRRLLQLVGRAQRERPDRLTPYVQAVAAMVRAASIDSDVGQAVLDGHIARTIASSDADEVLVAALAAYARALYLAGELENAWSEAMRAIEHPDAERRAPGYAYARSTLALVAAERRWLTPARAYAEKANSIVGGVASGRGWLGANAAAALGAVLSEAGNLAEAERELAYAEHFFQDEVATVHHAWILVLLARVRCRRGRLEEADATLRSAQDEIAQFADGGRVPLLAAEVTRELNLARQRAGGGELLEAPSEAELTVLRDLVSDSSAREIGERLFLSPNTVRSHTRSLYRKLGVSSRADAVARAESLGLLGQSKSRI